MKGSDVLLSSASVEWATPQDFFDRLDAEFGFDLDVCATAENAKCQKFYCESDDGLSKSWTGTVWMNPPYGKEISQWVRKAWESARDGATVVCLLPARTDTAWFHSYCLDGEVRLIRGRLAFGRVGNPAPFPSVVVVFRPGLVGSGLGDAMFNTPWRDVLQEIAHANAAACG